jgi:splicing factor 1
LPPTNINPVITNIIDKMAWRNQGITGSNNIPLGKRRFGGDTSSDRDVTPEARDLKRGRSPERSQWRGPEKRPRRPIIANTSAYAGADNGPKPRKKRNRWGDASENKAAGLMGLPTAIRANMTSEQLEAYTLHLRIEEISQKLRINDVVPADGDRSPSPPPQYDNHGRRINTREYRYRKRLEDERHKLVEKAMKIIPNYHPPQDYRRPTKTQEKVYVPVNDYPEINFSMIANPEPPLTNDDSISVPSGLEYDQAMWPSHIFGLVIGLAWSYLEFGRS